MFADILTTYRVSILIFIAALTLFLWKDRDNIEFHKIIFIRRTERGIDLIKKTASKFKKFWKAWSTLGVVVSVIISFTGIFMLGYQVLKALMVSKAAPAVGLVLPTISKTPSMGAGFIFIPFWYWIIGVGTVAGIHELMHGVIGISEGFNIKSVGWFVLLFIPGAFVEPEGEEMMPEKGRDESEDSSDSSNPWGDGPVMSKLRVLAAGSWSNICFAVIVLLLFLSVTVPSPAGGREIEGMYEDQGIKIVKVANKSPAKEQGFKEEMVIKRIGSHQIEDLEDFSNAAEDLEPNKTILISGTLNTTEFSINATPGVKQQNLTYKPAVLDRTALNMEKVIPGSFNAYLSLKNFVTDSSDKEKTAMWSWVREKSDVMDDKAGSEIKKLEAEEDDGYLGIYVFPERKLAERFEGKETILLFLSNLLYFLFGIHAGVAVFNLLPLKPLDGGWIVSEIVEEFKPEWEKLPVYITYLTASLFLLALGLPILL